MNGYRIARKGIDGKQIESLRRLALKVEPRVAKRRLDGRVAVPEIGEVAVGNDDHRGIDVVEAVDVALAAVGRKRSGAEPYHSDLERAGGRMHGFERASDAGSLRVIRRRPAREIGLEILGAVEYRSVPQRSVPAPSL